MAAAETSETPEAAEERLLEVIEEARRDAMSLSSVEQLS